MWSGIGISRNYERVISNVRLINANHNANFVIIIRKVIFEIGFRSREEYRK